MPPKKHPQAQLNALELAIVENAMALKRVLISELPQGDAVRADLLANALLVGARYQAQGTAEGAETIAAAIDRLTRAVLPRLERIEALLKPTEAANDPAPNKPGAAD